MASALKAAALARAAKRGTPGGRAAAVANFDKQVAKNRKGAGGGGKVNFKGSGRGAAYRGAATKVVRSGGGAVNAHRAGVKAEQAYSG